MTIMYRRSGRGQTVIIADPRDASLNWVLKGEGRGALAALVTLHDEQVGEVEAAIRILMRAKCDYYVCAGSQAEVLHDFIDELVLGEDPDTSVTTTWHASDRPADILDFFLDVAAPSKQAAVVLLREHKDDGLMHELLTRTSAQS